ncbi:MAG: tetratricopeptide repeat protein [Cyanobacteria bacterium TGS_CYA1]|nr:tetratricopeptide repeat protein [Cyanobacteria bacterium TGS_CYA1]
MELPRKLENQKRKNKLFPFTTKFVWALTCPLFLSLASCSFLDNKISASDPSHLSDQWKAHNQWWESIEDGDFALYVKQHDKSIEYFETAIKQASKFAVNDPRIAKSYVSLGRAYLEKSDFEKASEALKKGLALKEKLHGKDSNELSGVLTTLALVELKMNKPDEAKAYSDRATELRKKANDNSGSSEIKYVRGLLSSQTKGASNVEITQSFESAIKEFDVDFTNKKLLLDTVALDNYADCLTNYRNWLSTQKQQAKVDTLNKKLDAVKRYLNEFKSSS